VSVIVPVYNAARELPRLVASLRAQSYPADRVQTIMVDNGSTDDSADVMRSFADVGALSQTRFRGPGATRNAGIDRAEGEVLAFIDADCWAHAHWLSNGVGALMKSAADRAAGRVEFVLSQYPNLYETFDAATNFRQADFISQGWCGTGNLFVRREVFAEVGVFDAELVSHEDSEWGRRASRAGKSLVYAPDAVVYHRARRSLRSLVRKWIRTEYGAAQVFRRCGDLELHLWTKKANYRPLFGVWRRYPPEVRRCARLRVAIDLLANVLRAAGNYGSFRGYFGLGRPR